jgi:hypothetical protein
MAALPSLNNLSPDQWVEEMKALRDQVVDESARILDAHPTPERAAPPLQQLFARYDTPDLDLPAGRDIASPRFSLEVRHQGDMLIVWAFPTEEYESLVYTTHDHWWFDHRGVDNASRDRHDIHRTVTRRILDLLPWANEDDLLEIAAIEISSRAG